MTASRSNSLLEGALGLAARGIPVIPLRSRSKVPIHARWPELGLLDPSSIRIEWEQHPDANVGALCGADAFEGRGLTIVDVDLPDGPGTLEALEEESHGTFPFTSAVETPSGGMHYYLYGCTASWNPGPGLEIRSEGRQCAAPPSIHPNGGRYEWFQLTEPLGHLPAWLATPVCRQSPRAAFTPSGLRDPVLEVAPATYFERLCGLVRDRQGFVSCPVHPFRDVEPSCKVYDTAERGWFCYGEECRKGGDIVTLATYLAGMTPPLQGVQFWACLDYLRGVLA